MIRNRADIKTPLWDWKRNSKLSNKEISEILGITDVYVSKLLSGHQTPSPKLARRIHEITGISLENLLFPDQATAGGDDPETGMSTSLEEKSA